MNSLPHEINKAINRHIEAVAEEQIKTYPITVRINGLELDMEFAPEIKDGEIEINITEDDLDYFYKEISIKMRR